MNNIKKEFLPTLEDVEFFNENGYWIGGKVLEDSELEKLIEAQEKIYSEEYETGRKPWMGFWKQGTPGIRKTDNSHWSNLTLRNIATNPTIGAMAAKLMKTPEIRLWHDQLIYKPGEVNGKSSGNVGWHQDTHYWQCTVPDMITAWVAFVDVDLSNGCMHFVPGSNKWNLLKENDFFDQDLDKLKSNIQKETGEEFKTTSAILKAGQVSFHHAYTVHGSGPNKTDNPRRSLVLHLMPDHAHYISGHPLGDHHMNAILLRDKGGKDGDLFTGEEWPILYSEK